MSPRQRAGLTVFFFVCLGVGMWRGSQPTTPHPAPRTSPLSKPPRSTPSPATTTTASVPRAPDTATEEEDDSAGVMLCRLPALETTATTGELQVQAGEDGFPFLQVALRDGNAVLPIHLLGDGTSAILEVDDLGITTLTWTPDHAACTVSAFILMLPPTTTTRCPLVVPAGLEVLFQANPLFSMDDLPHSDEDPEPLQARSDRMGKQVAVYQVTSEHIGDELIIEGPKSGSGVLYFLLDGVQVSSMPLQWSDGRCDRIMESSTARVSGTVGPLLGTRSAMVDICGHQLPVDADGAFQGFVQPVACDTTAWREDGRLRAYSEIIPVNLRERDDVVLHFSLPQERIGGIGFRLAEHPEGILITQVYPDTPADQTGLRRGDIITAVDGVAVADLSTEAFIRIGTGPVDTEVRLSLRHEDGSEEDITVTRDTF